MCSTFLFSRRVLSYIYMTELERIKTTLCEYMDEFRHYYNVEEMGVFGSLVHGDNTGESDVDILVRLSSPIGLFRFVRLERRLEEILGYDVDLVMKDGLKSAIKEDILKDTHYVEA